MYITRGLGGLEAMEQVPGDTMSEVPNLFRLRTGKPQTGSNRRTVHQPTLCYTQYKKGLVSNLQYLSHFWTSSPAADPPADWQPTLRGLIPGCGPGIGNLCCRSSALHRAGVQWDWIQGVKLWQWATAEGITERREATGRKAEALTKSSAQGTECTDKGGKPHENSDWVIPVRPECGYGGG